MLQRAVNGMDLKLDPGLRRGDTVCGVVQFTT